MEKKTPGLPATITSYDSSPSFFFATTFLQYYKFSHSSFQPVIDPTTLLPSIRKKGFGPKETQVALGVSRDSKDIKDSKSPRFAPKQSPLMFNLAKAPPKHCQSIPEYSQSIFKAFLEHLQGIPRASLEHS